MQIPIIADARLNDALNLPSLTPQTICHGYANACVCPTCLERQQPAPPIIRLPWETEAA